MMFGKHFEAAEATVLFSESRTKFDMNSFTTGNIQEYDIYELILEVRTHDGQTFRTSIKDIGTYLQPKVGDVVKVQYDPKSKKVKIVTKGDVRYDVDVINRAREAKLKAEHDAILAAPAGTPLPQTLAYDAEVSRFTLEAQQHGTGQVRSPEFL